MSAVLALRGVTKRYSWRSPWVLSGADLSLEEGSLTSIVGTNGAGKSTLLRIAAGVTSPSGGTAHVPRKVGYVPERQSARSKFSGTQYLAHMGRIRGLDPHLVTRRGTELLIRLGVRPGPEVPWNDLSKGNRQKVVLAQAFLGQLDIIVLDEPFSGLDREARVVLDELISEVRAQGTSVVVSSHDTAAGISQSYRLVDGRLDEYTRAMSASRTGGLVRRVELVRRDQGESVGGLTQRADVVRWRTIFRGAGLELDVSSEGCDDLIREALDLGWSVRSVVPVRGGE